MHRSADDYGSFSALQPREWRSRDSCDSSAVSETFRRREIRHSCSGDPPTRRRCGIVRTGVRMSLRLVPAFPLFIALAATSAPHVALIAQPSAQTIAGAWVLNPALTQRPEEIGFTPEWARAQGSG